MSKKFITKKVTCEFCGKKGTVKISKDGKPIGDDWVYYGKVNVNLKTDKFLYRIVFDKNGNIVLKNGEMKFKKTLNKNYDKNAKPKYFEEWACKKDAKSDKKQK